jgi:Cys-tRNA(Pro)/Cys-tRNA(Cys) deacylase
MKCKTNSMRLLESRRIPYQVHEFPTEIRSAEDAAQVMGAPPDHVFKTLVVLRERGRPLLVMAPGNKALDLKLLAKAAGEKKLHMATHKEAEALTGLEVGGISALALLNKGFDVYADDTILSLAEVYVSAGSRGINLSLCPQDLLQVTHAKVAPVSGDQPEETATASELAATL